MRFFVTGIGGFAGGHLATLLLSQGHRVSGLVRDEESAAFARAILARHAPAASAEDVILGDVCDATDLQSALARQQPDVICHLAAQSSVSASEGDAAHSFAVNTVGTLQVLSAARTLAHPCRVLLVSSGECYGRAAEAGPASEDTPLRPLSVYAASKAAAEILFHQAVDAYGVDAICIRAFNHTGPGQTSRFVCSDFARQIVAVERGEQSALRVGNLDAVRDFLDVRDVVAAYAVLCQRGETGRVYNVCSGVGRKIADVLADLCALSPRRPTVEPDPLRMRPADVPSLVGDNTRVRALGWQPSIAWTQTLADLLAAWRQA